MGDFAYENYEFDSDVYEEIETTYNLLKEQSVRKKLTRLLSRISVEVAFHINPDPGTTGQCSHCSSCSTILKNELFALFVLRTVRPL